MRGFRMRCVSSDFSDSSWLLLVGRNKALAGRFSLRFVAIPSGGMLVVCSLKFVVYS